MRAHVALAFQEAFLFGDTVRENLTLGEEVGDDELRWALEVARADRFVARLPDGLDQHARRARASRCRAASASAWPWPGPCCAGRAC